MFCYFGFVVQPASRVVQSKVASCDADGAVKLWDARMVAEIGTMEAGQHPLNSVCLDRSATRLAAASNDGTIKVKPCLQGLFCIVYGASFQTPPAAIHPMFLPPRTWRRTQNKLTSEPKETIVRAPLPSVAALPHTTGWVAAVLFLSSSTHPVCILSTLSTAT